MKLHRLLFVIGCLAVLTSLGASQESRAVIQVSCSDANGCFRLLGQAIESAPEGATLQLGSGVFYELPIVIDKSLTIRGTRGSDPVVIATIIYAFQGGTLLAIRSASRPISINLEDLSIQGGFTIQGPPEGNPEQLRVLLRNSALTTRWTAIYMQGKTQLTLQGNDIRSESGFIYAEDGSQLIVQDNQIFVSLESGSTSFGVATLQDIKARFERNRISQGPRSRRTVGVLALGGRYDFVENLIEGHIVGVSLGGKAVADFQRNRFVENEMGISLAIPPCILDPAPELKLEGFISGADNEFAFNSKADLCPALDEYPWPPGFIKNP